MRFGLAAAAAASAAASAAAVSPATDQEAPAAAPTGAGFVLERSSLRPGTAFFDGERRIRLRYRFRADRRLDVVVKVVRSRNGEPVRRWVEPELAPGRFHTRRWDGRRGNGKVAPDGPYELRVGPLGHRGARAGRLRFFGHVFPVAGPHSYGDRFGEARSGGRVHEGQDLPAACGTPLVAARGGRVQARGRSDALYGYWVLIDGRATKRDYFYSHLALATPVSDGDRVRTGERIGEVGKTGNARSEFCQLHFELWPRGYRRGAPHDPLAQLRKWDRYS